MTWARGNAIKVPIFQSEEHASLPQKSQFQPMEWVRYDWMMFSQEGKHGLWTLFRAHANFIPNAHYQPHLHIQKLIRDLWNLFKPIWCSFSSDSELQVKIELHYCAIQSLISFISADLYSGAIHPNATDDAYQTSHWSLISCYSTLLISTDDCPDCYTRKALHHRPCKLKHLVAMPEHACTITHFHV